MDAPGKTLPVNNNSQIAAADITKAVALLNSDAQIAAEIQYRLRTYQPVWELLRRTNMVAPLKSFIETDPTWWRPTRIALSVISGVLDLCSMDTARDWLAVQYSSLQETAASTATTDLEDPVVQELLGIPLVRDTCEAVHSFKTADQSQWVDLAQSVLICLYDFADGNPNNGPNNYWLESLAHARPSTAAHVLFFNLETQERLIKGRRIISALTAARSLAFIQALESLGDKECSVQLASELSTKFSQNPDIPLVELPTEIAAAMINQTHQGAADECAENDSSINTLEQAWDMGQAFMACLSMHIGDAHRHRGDSLMALASFQLGLQLDGNHSELRAACASSLIDLDRPEEALALLTTAPENVLQQDFSVAIQEARARVALIQAEGKDPDRYLTTLQAIDRAAGLAENPDQNVGVANLYIVLNEDQSAVRHLEKALDGKAFEAAWLEELGRLYKRLHDWHGMENCFAQIVALEPDNVSALLKLTSAFCAQGKMQEALKSVSHAANLEPHNPRVMMDWVTTAHAAREWDTTVTAGKAALALDPENDRLHVFIGEAFAALNQDDEALFHLLRATRMGGTCDPLSWMALAGYYRERGQMVQAEKTLKDGIEIVGDANATQLLITQAAIYEETGRLTEAKSGLDRAYQAGDRSCQLLNQYGRVLSHLGHHKQAIGHLEECLENPDAGGSTYHEMALALERAGKGTEAMAAIVQAAQLSPQDGTILGDAGRLSLDAQDFDSAVVYLQDATDRCPESVDFWSYLGQALQGVGSLKSALDAFSAAARLAPSNPYLQQHIGIVCTRLGQYDTAITSLTEASHLLPGDLAVQQSLATALESAGWWNQATRVRRKIAELKPGNSRILVAWASAARQAGSLGEAEEAIASASEIAPDDPLTVLELGLLRKAEGDSAGAVQLLTNLVRTCEEAVILRLAGDALVDMAKLEDGAKAYGRSVDLDPKDAVTQSRLGSVSARMGDYERALQAYQVATQQAPDDPLHQVALGKMHARLNNHRAAVDAWNRAHEILPNDASIMKDLAGAHVHLGDAATALVLYEQAASTAEKASEPAGKIWREAGRIALELSELEKSQAFLVRALGSDSNDPETQSLVGALADRLGKPEEALQAYRKAAELAPEKRDYQLQLADALNDRGREMDALDVWKELVGDEVENGESIDLYERMANLYARSGRYLDAKQNFEAALERDPDRESIKRQLASVLVEENELLDYQRRAGFPVSALFDDIQLAADWLVESDTPQEKRDYARARLLLGGVNEAIEGLKDYLAGFGNLGFGDLNAQRALGVAYRQANLLDASIKALSAAIRLVSKDVRTLVELVQTYLMAEQPDRAISLLEWISGQTSDDPILYRFTALSAFQVGDHDRAIDALREAIQLKPDVSSWHQQLSQWLRLQGRAEEALPYAQASVALTKDQENSIRAQARIELAGVLKSLNRFSEAITQQEMAVELGPDNESWLIELGKLYLLVKRAEEADRCFQEVPDTWTAESSGEVTDFYLSWSKACIDLEQFENARIYLDKAIEISPDDATTMAGLGELQAAKGEWQEALACYQSALVRANQQNLPLETRSEYHFKIARAYNALGVSDQAIEELEKAAPLDSENGKVFAFLGDIHQELGNHDLARQAYQQAVQSRPSDVTYVLQLAQFLQDEGQLDQALDLLSRAIALQSVADLWIEMARVYERRHQRAEQMEALHRAVAEEPNYASAHFELGLAFKQRKAYRQAIFAFEKATEIEPENEQAHKQLAAVIAMSLAGNIGRGRGKG